MTWTGSTIRALRKRLGYNQSQMADALGYGSLQRVSELEREEQEPTEQLARLLDHLDAHGDLIDRRTSAEAHS